MLRLLTRQCHPSLPVLKPDLHLPGAEPRNLSRESFAVRGVGMRLLGELAHKKSCLLVREPVTRLASARG